MNYKSEHCHADLQTHPRFRFCELICKKRWRGVQLTKYLFVFTWLHILGLERWQITIWRPCRCVGNNVDDPPRHVRNLALFKWYGNSYQQLKTAVIAAKNGDLRTRATPPFLPLFPESTTRGRTPVPRRNRRRATRATQRRTRRTSTTATTPCRKRRPWRRRSKRPGTRPRTARRSPAREWWPGARQGRPVQLSTRRGWSIA